MIYTTTSTTKNIRSLVGKCFLLVISMLLCGISAWAADSKWTNGGTFNITQTLSESVVIPEGKTVEIKGDLTIKPNGKKNITLDVKGKLIVTGTITLTYNNPSFLNYYYGNVENYGSIEIGDDLIIEGSKNTFVSNGILKVAGDVENSGTLTVNNDLTIQGNLTNKETVNIQGNVIVNGNATNSGTINMQGGILRIGTYESGKIKEGTGDFTLKYGSSLLYDNNGGKESNVEVRGDLNGDKEARIKSKNGGKGNLAVVGTYYDEVQDYGTYHPDWGVEYQKKGNKIISVSFVKKDNPYVLLSASSYSLTPKSAGTGFWADFFASFGLGTSISNDAKAQLNNIVEQYKSINPENLAEILQEISTLLPITLNYFVANQDGEEVVFEWQTSSEVNNDFFTIEYSIDGVHFKELLREDGNGTTSVTNDYTVSVSADGFAGVTYFRLKQTDFNGEYSYSDVILLNVENETSLYVYPNPAVDVITIAGSFERVSVCDAYSRTLSVQQESTNSFNVSALPVGTYYVVATTKQGKKVLPFVKR